MMTMIHRLPTCCRAVAVLIIFGTLVQRSEASDRAGLYEIALTSARDAELVSESGVDAVLRGGNSYLVTATPETTEELRRRGISCRQVLPGFDREDWVVLMREDASVQAEELSAGLPADERFRFDAYLIVKRKAAGSFAYAGSGTKLVEFPAFHVPIEFVPDRASPVSLGQSPGIDSLLSLISKDSIESYVRRLEEFGTRFSYSDSVIAARDWLVEKFGEFGYDAVIDSFYRDLPAPYGRYMFNVAADHTGTAAPEMLIILCGHYDSISSDPYVAAPGADDNATGTAFCLEIARILQDFETAKTVRFICFSGEEQGLLGSVAYVQNHPGLKIEVVINADMIGTALTHPDLVRVFQNAEAVPHADFCRANLEEYTSVTGLNPGNTAASDHVPFQQAGYRAMFVHENDFSPHYHKTHDLADYLDFDYMTEIVTGFAAATYTTAIAAPFVEGPAVSDPGKGDRLLVRWEQADDARDFGYDVRVGVMPGVYTRSYPVPGSENSHVVDGLTEGRQYYISVKAVTVGAPESVASIEVTGTPLAVPHPATNVMAATAFRAIELTWGKSEHPDVVAYEVFRSIEGEDDFVHVATTGEDIWMDTDISGDMYYDYFVIAVDEDSLESSPSDTTTGRGAFFDRDLLVVIKPPAGVADDTSAAMARYRQFFCGIRHDCLIIDEEPVSVAELGQYRSVMWINDGYPRLLSSMSALDWVAGYGTNVLLCGSLLASQLGSYSRDWFGLNDFAESYQHNFIYAAGEEGWPDAILDTAVGSQFNQHGQVRYISTVNYYDHDPEVSTPIYRYQATDTLNITHDKPCGISSENGSSKIILLGFPIFHLDQASGLAIISRAADLFGVPRNVAGDVNDDSRRSLVDCVLMLKILYWDYPFPDQVNRLDVNGDCLFDLRDVVHLLAYVYLGGIDPTCGCIESY